MSIGDDMLHMINFLLFPAHLPTEYYHWIVKCDDICIRTHGVCSM